MAMAAILDFVFLLCLWAPAKVFSSNLVRNAHTDIATRRCGQNHLSYIEGGGDLDQI